MSQVRHILDALERIAPKRFAFPTDKVGLQVGDPASEVRRGVVSLDRSLGAVTFAAEREAQMLVSHHPLIFEPVGSVLQTSHVGRTILELSRKGISFAAAHTNWDSARGGINDALAEILGLEKVSCFGTAAMVRQLKVIVPCPSGSVQAVIDAASEAGAGVIGEYSRCAFTVAGTGTFLGSASSNPAVGKAGQVERADEVRVEMILPEDRARAVSRAIQRSHPYEEPAVDFFTLNPNPEQAAGRLGSLAKPLSFQQVVVLANERLDTLSWAWGDPDRSIKKIGIVGGAADSEWREARNAGADLLLTGEVKQHVALEAAEQGFAMIASGHYATEQPGCATLRDRLSAEAPDVEWLLYVPPKGFSGRPI